MRNYVYLVLYRILYFENGLDCQVNAKVALTKFSIFNPNTCCLRIAGNPYVHRVSEWLIDASDRRRNGAKSVQDWQSRCSKLFAMPNKDQWTNPSRNRSAASKVSPSFVCFRGSLSPAMPQNKYPQPSTGRLVFLLSGRGEIVFVYVSPIGLLHFT